MTDAKIMIFKVYKVQYWPCDIGKQILPIAQGFKLPGKFLLKKEKDFEVSKTKQTTYQPKNSSSTKLYDNSPYRCLVNA